MNGKGFGRKRWWTNRGTSRPTIQTLAWRDSEKSRKTEVSTAGVTTEVQTENSPNANLNWM
jgi:hypothetical protein